MRKCYLNEQKHSISNSEKFSQLQTLKKKKRKLLLQIKSPLILDAHSAKFICYSLFFLSFFSKTALNNPAKISNIWQLYFILCVTLVFLRKWKQKRKKHFKDIKMKKTWWSRNCAWKLLISSEWTPPPLRESCKSVLNKKKRNGVSFCTPFIRVLPTSGKHFQG